MKSKGKGEKRLPTFGLGQMRPGRRDSEVPARASSPSGSHAGDGTCHLPRRGPRLGDPWDLQPLRSAGRKGSADAYLHLSALPEGLNTQCGAGAGPGKRASPHCPVVASGESMIIVPFTGMWAGDIA